MSKLHLEVFTGSEQAFQVTSTIVYGEKNSNSYRCTIFIK